MRPRTAPEMDGHRDMDPPSTVGGWSSEDVPCVRERLRSRLGEEGRLPRLREDACRDAFRLALDGSGEAWIEREELALAWLGTTRSFVWHRA